MAIQGVDLSFARPGGKALAAAGKQFVVRYLTGDGKALGGHEAKDYHQHGVAICLVFESTRGRALDGAQAGRDDGARAEAAATALGVPPSVPIYFAVDFDATAGQQPAIDAYLRGAGTAIGDERIGVYGGIRVLKRCRANRTARWFWQTYAWSGGKIAAFIHLYQYRNHQVINGGLVDFDRAYRANFGQWPQPAPAVPGQRYRVSISGGSVRLHSTIEGPVIGAVSVASYVCERSRVDGLWWYTIAAGSRTGQALKPNRFTSARFM